VDGNTYVNANLSITFGAVVSDTIPTLLDHGSPEDLHIGYWTVASDNRWEITEVGSVSGSFCSETGQYDLTYTDNDCDDIHFSVVEDECEDRVALLDGVVFTLVDRDTFGSCVEEGTVLQTQLGESSMAPSFSRVDATVVFGTDGYCIVSVGERGTLYQHWELDDTNDGETTTITDIGSTGGTGSPNANGDDFGCASWSEGVYYSDWDADCSAQLCGITDSCISRGELFHATSYNGFQPIDGCVRDVHFPTLVGRGECNPDSDTWEEHPYDCINQAVEGGCMFCLGRANDMEVRQCLDRDHAGCNQIFNSIAAKAFCTLEFECPASTISFSITLFISSLVALLLIR
jgi:hypothetical protein